MHFPPSQPFVAAPLLIPKTDRLESVRKIAPSISERAVTVEETLRNATRIAAKKGVTRVADISGLDRLGIPVYTAVIARSDDAISVYNGKGLTAVESRAGAFMEAIERQTVLYSDLAAIEGSYARLSERGMTVIHPRAFNHKLRESYSDKTPYSWIQGHDLIADDPVLVPAALAAYGPKYGGACSPYETYSTNGLASGNCFEEAVCHALCELLECDAWTFADLRSRWIPWARREALFGVEAGANGCDDADACPRIDLSGAREPITALVEKFHAASLNPIVRDITSEIGIPVVIASVSDDSMPGFPQAHSGLGAHPNARIAVIRALTELAQSRAVDIQGVREDLIPAGVPADSTQRHTQRVHKVEPQRWMLQQAGAERSFQEIASIANEDIAEDIRLILSRLAQHGMERAIVVDFSEPDSPFAVVRALVPGLEFWTLDQGRLGDRAVEFWRRHA